VLHWLAEPLEVRLDALGAVVLDGLSYRRAARIVGICKTEVGDSLDLLLASWPRWAVPARRDVRGHPPRPARTAGGDDRGRRGGVRGWLATRVQRPGGWANQKVLYDAKRRTHTAQGVALSTIHGDLLWCDGGWPGSCHEHEVLAAPRMRPASARAR
jgi:hypothetical protein